MESTNFDESIIPKLNDLLDFVLANTHSDFYRKKYAGLEIGKIKSYEDFLQIPFLVKDEILEVDIGQRIFIPENEVADYSFSSGTTGHPIPTIIPHESIDYAAKNKGIFNKERFERLGVKKVLVLMQPTAGLFRRSFSNPNPSAIFLPGDVHNIKLAALIMKTLCINGIITTPTILDFLVDELKSVDFDFVSVKWISIGSEFCSTLRYNYFRAQFPNAYFHMRYGNSEIGGGGRHYRCEHLAQSGLPNVFHVDHAVELIEVVGENDTPMPLGETGEIVHTDLKPKAFPLLRYRMKDMGSLTKTKCPCGNNMVLTIDGRSGFDVLKIHGATIHAELVSRAVATIQDIVESRFQLHVYEKNSNGKPKLQLEFHLKLKPQHEHSKKDDFLIEILKEKLSSSLQLSGKMTLAEFVAKGIFLPPEIVFVSAWDCTTIKSKNIISHLN